MEPVSAALIGPVCLLALGCAVATVVLWRRLAGTGVRAVLARSGLLVAAQAALTASVVLLANRYFVFYATWSDLLGNDPAHLRVQHVQPQHAAGRLVERTETGLVPGRAGHRPDPAKDGRVDRLTIHGARSGMDAEAYVYLPPRYFQRTERLPVVVLMGDGAPTDLLRNADLPRAAGRTQPMVYAMVRLHGPADCMDVPGRHATLGATYLTQDLPEALASQYRVTEAREGWAVAGTGDGGWCAARLAMLRSDRFAAAASLGGGFGAPDGDLYGGSERYRLGNDLLWRLQNVPPPPVEVLVAAGKGDEQARRFAALARPPMRVETSLVDGSPVSASEIPPALAWLGARLRIPPAE
ncbi:alpha/beta hydrolase-fold protein [Actinomadura luteofluorescens]|uniref:alpha/beta hydrolase n=1 Tax=Actinomadura luteofluorescens TaxID=46163 RepID=UPI0021642205|nr:alpha/beta hydrolase-fold protein [Actinomadura glauciflava]MCR3741761.1 putative esterase [Actinomadura glauciflava]